MKEININIRVEHYQLDELNTADRELVERALEATNGAYAPYSNFYVGAALRLADGTIVTGANQENAAFPSGTCAERTAIAKAVSEGHRSFRRIAIAGRCEQLCVPCGTCRQVLREFAPDIEVICLNGKGEARHFALKELLPESFGPEYL